MSRVHVFTGCFRPDRDEVVKDGLALDLTQFGRLTLDAQKAVLDVGHRTGDPGVPDPDWNVPPMCRRGVSMAELQKIFESSDARIKQGIQRKMANDRFARKVQQAQQSVEVNNVQHATS